MPDVGLAIQVAPDRQVAAVEIAPIGQSPLRLILELDELDRLIGELGNARSQIVLEWVFGGDSRLSMSELDSGFLCDPRWRSHLHSRLQSLE